jgi:hypothetical protein
MQSSPNTAAAAVHAKRKSRGRALELTKQWSMLSEEARLEAKQLAYELKCSGIITTHKLKLASYKKAVVRRLLLRLVSWSLQAERIAAKPASPYTPSPPTFQTGAEMVDWMVMTERANSREEATQRGQQLIVGNLLCSATEERDFADSKHALYRCVCVCVCARCMPPQCRKMKSSHVVRATSVINNGSQSHYTCDAEWQILFFVLTILSHRPLQPRLPHVTRRQPHRPLAAPSPYFWPCPVSSEPQKVVLRCSFVPPSTHCYVATVVTCVCPVLAPDQMAPPTHGMRASALSLSPSGL